MSLSKATRNRAQSIQSPASSIAKVPLSLPVRGCDHRNREDNATASTRSPSLSPRASPEQPAVSHMHTATAGFECNPALLWRALTATASPETAASGSSYYSLLFGQTKPSTHSHCSSDPRHYTSSYQHHSKPGAGHRFSGNTHLQQPQHQLEQRNSHSSSGRQPCVVFISFPPNRTACSISSAGIPLLHSSSVPLSALSAAPDVAGCDGRSKDCHSSRGLASLAGESSLSPAPDKKHLNRP